MSKSGNVTMPAMRTIPPTPRDGYLAVARELLPGVEALSTLTSIPTRAAALIAAQTLECALKAFLWHKGQETAIREPKVRHDLAALWKMAYEQGLPISETPPDWCRILSVGHGPNFYLRYQEGEERAIVNGGQTPALIAMTAALKELFKTVELAVKG